MKFTSQEEAREAILKLYAEGTEVRMNIRLQKPRTELLGIACVIKGAYPHMFRIEASLTDCKKIYSIQYSDLITGKAEILD